LIVVSGLSAQSGLIISPRIAQIFFTTDGSDFHGFFTTDLKEMFSKNINPVAPASPQTFHISTATHPMRHFSI
jgi:hypothetical protein